MNVSTFDIYIYNTFYKFQCALNGDILSNLNMAKFLQNLTEYKWMPNGRYWKVMYIYCYYNHETHFVHLPINTLHMFLEYCKPVIPNVQYVDALPGRTLSLRLKPNFDDKPDQIDLIEYLVDPTKHVKLLEASTGIGKTYCSIKSGLVHIGEPFLIQTASLFDYWKSEIMKFVKIRESDIYIIKGAKSLVDLFKDKRHKPKCFIASIRTLVNFVTRKKIPYCDMMTPEEFVNTYGLGGRIVDEAHENLFANTMIDLTMNVPQVFNLSASYGRGNPQSAKIFDILYPPELRFGSHHQKKYTKVYMYGYVLNPYISNGNYIGQNGYMHAKYELRICNNYNTKEQFLDTVIKPLIQAHYLNYRQLGEKLLILAYTQIMVDTLHNYVSKLCNELNCITFLGGDEDDKHMLCDIVVSTMKSCGTGRDIKQLITTINTVSFKAETLTKQCMGRLRHIKDRDTIFVDMFNKDIGSHIHHKRIRLQIYEDRALSVYKGNLS